MIETIQESQASSTCVLPPTRARRQSDVKSTNTRTVVSQAQPVAAFLTFAFVRDAASTSGKRYEIQENLKMNLFFWDHRRYLLKQPVAYSRRQEGGGWIYTCERYGLHAFAENQEEALAQFNEEFAFLYGGLVGEPDDALTHDAVLLRNKLIEDVCAVEVVN